MALAATEQTGQCIDGTNGAGDFAFSEMAPFACSKLNRVDYKNLCASSTGQLADGLVENVLAALNWAVQR